MLEKGFFSFLFAGTQLGFRILREVPIVVLYELHQALFLHVHLAVGAHLEILRIHAGLVLRALRSALAFLNVVQEVLPVRVHVFLCERRLCMQTLSWE